MTAVNVFSTVPYPLTVSYDAGGSKKSTTRSTTKIMPGRNQIDGEVWAKVENCKSVKSRVDKGYIRATEDTSGDLTHKEKLDLLGTPSRGFIQELSAKASPVATGEKEDGDFYTLEEQRERGLI